MTYQMIDEDIEFADCSTINCPVVRCFKRTHKITEMYDVRCGNDYLNWNSHPLNKSYRLPLHVKEFITEHDAGKEVKPIEFELVESS